MEFRSWRDGRKSASWRIQTATDIEWGTVMKQGNPQAVVVQEAEDIDGRELALIGAVAERVGLSLKTVRKFEAIGLVVPVARTDGGFRLYDRATIERLLLIKQMKPLGFTVDEIRLFMDAKDRLASGRLTPHERRGVLQQIALFDDAVKQKVCDLRERLAVAEAFAAELSQDG